MGREVMTRFIDLTDSSKGAQGAQHTVIHLAPFPGALLRCLGSIGIFGSESGGRSGRDGSCSRTGWSVLLGLRWVVGPLVLGATVAITFHVWSPTLIPSG